MTVFLNVCDPAKTFSFFLALNLHMSLYFSCVSFLFQALQVYSLPSVRQVVLRLSGNSDSEAESILCCGSYQEHFPWRGLCRLSPCTHVENKHIHWMVCWFYLPLSTVIGYIGDMKNGATNPHHSYRLYFISHSARWSAISEIWRAVQQTH